MEKQLSLTVCVATYNRARNLNKCLESLTKQTDADFDVLIIDGGSSDKTHEVLEQYKDKLSIRVIIDKIPHLSYIRDLGWRKSKSDIIAWIDDDVVVEPQWVKAIVAQLVEPTVGGVTGPTVISQKLLANRDVFFFHTTTNPLLKMLGKLYFKFFLQGEKYGIGKIYPSGAWSPGSNFPQSRKLKKPLEVDYLEACNFAIPRKVLEEVDGFDLGYKSTSEWCEIDLAFRIRKCGYKLIFDPNVAVKHHISSSGVYSRRLNIYHRLCNFLRFYLTTYYPKSAKGFLLFFLYVIFLVVYYIYIWLKSSLKHFF